MEAYRIRLMNLFEAGKVERALRLLATGYEQNVDDEKLPNDDGLGLEIPPQLDTIEKIGVGKEVAVSLVTILEDAVNLREDPDFEAEAKETFAWAIEAAVELAKALTIIREELLTSQQTDQVVQQGTSTALSSGTSALSRTVTPMAAALDPGLAGFDDALTVLQSLRALFKEFEVMMTMEKFAEEIERRRVLAQFAKKVFKYVGNPEAGRLSAGGSTRKGKGKGKMSSSQNVSNGVGDASEQSHTALYRLAQVLGFERSRLRGILAEEAARNGDFRTALVLSKELFDKFPDSQTARTLQRVAHLLTEYAADNKQVYRDVKEFKSHFRLTSRIMQLSGQAFCVCDEEAIQKCLDDYKNYELQHSVFTQCDAGDYEALVATDVKPFDDGDPFRSSLLDFGEQAGSSSSSSSAWGPASANTESSKETEKEEEPVSAEMEIANIGDRFATSLFEENFRESSLVLSTETAMSLVSNFVLDACAAQDEEPQDEGSILGLRVETSGKGKQEVQRSHPAHSGKMLAEYLVNNKSLQTVLRVLQRAKESVLRAGGPRGKEVWQTVVDFQNETLGRLLTAVMSSRAIDQKLAVGCLLSMPMDIGFEAFKVKSA